MASQRRRHLRPEFSHGGTGAVSVGGSRRPASATARQLVSGLQEREKVGVDDVGVGGGHAVREIITVGLERPVLQQRSGFRPGGDIGHDLVVDAVHHQSGNRDLLEVLGEVGLGEGDDAVVVGQRVAHHALAPPVRDDGCSVLFGDFAPLLVEVVERARR